jgi:MOSC domain-containing protein YiiM
MSHVVSLNVGRPRAVEVRKGTVVTSIFKTPVEGRRAVRPHNIEGDEQADLTVHGGPHKAVYCYPDEHYGFWREQLPAIEFVPGMFGENLTTRGLLEQEVFIGDRYRVGSAVLQVTQPRMPCFKLGIRFDRPDMVKRFWQSGRPGIYFSVVEEGDLGAGDPIERLTHDPDSVSIQQVVALYTGDQEDAELLKRALRSPLQGGWKQGLRDRWS